MTALFTDALVILEFVGDPLVTTFVSICLVAVFVVFGPFETVLVDVLFESEGDFLVAGLLESEIVLAVASPFCSASCFSVEPFTTAFVEESRRESFGVAFGCGGVIVADWPFCWGFV